MAQGFIQPIAQGNQMLIPNNGNPNTVYNRAAPAAPVQGWAPNPITPAANYTGLNVQDVIAQANQGVAQNGWVAPAAQAPAATGIVQLPTGWAESIQNFTPKPAPTTPDPTPTPTAPTIDANTKWVEVTNGVPGMNTALYQSDPAYKQAYDETLAIHQKRYGKGYTNKSNVGVLTSDLQKAYNRIKGSAASSGGNTTAPQLGGGSAPSTGAGGVDIGALNQYVMKTDANIIDRGWNTGGGTVQDKLNDATTRAVNVMIASPNANTVMEMLDMLTEPFLPGNLYMSELGKANMPNVLTSVLNQVVPGLGTLGKWIASKIPQDSQGLLGKIRDFFQKGEFQEGANEIYKEYDMDKARDNAVYGPGISVGGGGEGGGGGFIDRGNSGGWMDWSDKINTGRTGTVTVGTTTKG